MFKAVRVLNVDRRTKIFYIFLTVHHSIDLFHLPTLVHNSFIH